MTPHELADALEALAEEPTLCTALSAADVTELRQAARLLRELEAVRVAAEAFKDCAVMADDDDGRGWYMLMINHKGEPPREERDALRAALARVGQ